MRKVIETIPSADGVRTAGPLQTGGSNVREERVGGGGLGGGSGAGWDRFDADETRVSGIAKVKAPRIFEQMYDNYIGALHTFA